MHIYKYMHHKYIYIGISIILHSAKYKSYILVRFNIYIIIYNQIDYRFIKLWLYNKCIIIEIIMYQNSFISYL